MHVLMAAPTGKAAKRLEQVTGRRAQTIHRLLGYNGEEWQHNAENPIEADVVIVDEVSMCDVPLAYHLLSAIDFNCTRLILAGDHNQLPPVGPGNVLRDILTHDLIPYTVLDEVVRQAGPLRRNSLEVLNGRAVGLRKSDPVTSDWKVVTRYEDAEDALNFLLRLYQRVFAERLGYDILRDIQVLAPQRNGAVGVENLNLALQAVIQEKLFGRRIPPVKPNRRPPLYPGDKVMQIKNDYAIDVMNGHIGYVVESEPKEKRWVVDFEDRGRVELNDEKIQRVVLAYCVTIHKSQGSEFPCAVCILHSSHSFMLHRNLAYTAVTRARNQAVIIGDRKGIQRAVRIQKVDDRRTILDVTRGVVP
jgi:exodeoxyribonuclease V alpha subunit